MSDIVSVDSAEAVTRAANGTWLLDVREQSEWDLGHSPLAHLVPLSELGARLAEIPMDESVLVVCRSGARSLRATEALVGAGFDAVNVSGGMLAWSRAGGELVAETAEVPRIE
jgi:rhodanese-related sulfurtransferase